MTEYSEYTEYDDFDDFYAEDWDDDDGLTDAEADAMTLAGAGWGTDEDYPCCGHTPSDPCDYSGPTAEDYFAAYERGTWDPYDDVPDYD